MVKDFNITSKNSVLEIGSNDGTFLKNIKDLSNVKVLGIDPSDYMCKLANKKGIRTLSKFFNYQSSKLIEKKYGKFDFLYGANVFNHIDDPKNFLKCCKLITKPKSIIILEVPDLNSLFKGVGFDTIYHEHRPAQDPLLQRQSPLTPTLFVSVPLYPREPFPSFRPS